MLKVGEIRIDWLDGGEFALDGGAMFGVVPAALWQRKCQPDDQNRVPIHASPLLIRTGGLNIVVDTGLGNKLTPKQQAIFGVSSPWRVPESLADLGLTPADIDLVILTHMDWDHASGVTSLDADGRLAPTFPRARHIVQQAEWDDVRRPNRRTRYAYWPENWEPIAAAGLVEPVSGPAELAPGIWVCATGGHTRGHQLVLLESGGETALHLADLLPTHAHLNPLWVMAYDNYPLDSVEAKAQWLEQVRAGGWRLLFYHDAQMAACRLDAAGEPAEVLGREAVERAATPR